ncbi:helix-turn-helix domain-containing protein [Streptomyces sp. NPDC055239]
MNATFTEKGLRPAAPPHQAALPSADERRRLREQWGLTPHQVAAAFGVTVMTVQSWEAGRTSPRGERRRAYAQFLKGLGQGMGADRTPRCGIQKPRTTMVVAMRPGAAPMASGRPVLSALDPVSPQRVRRLRLAAAGIGLWSVFVHLMVTVPIP